MKIPPHIVKGNHKRGHGTLVCDYWDMLKEVPLMQAELEAYIKSQKPMIYWQTWQQYQAAKVIRIHPMYKD